MKFDAVIVRDSEGDRRLQMQDLPLRLGTGADCQIRLPGPGSNAVALLDELDGEPFVQPIGRSDSLKINGDVLTAARRLKEGDELQFYGTSVVVGQDAEALLLQIRLEGSAYITKPPEHADTTATSAEETIAPTVFKSTLR